MANCMKSSIRRVVLLRVLLWGTIMANWLFPVHTAGQENGSSLPVKKQGGPVVITGDKLSIDSEHKIATYTGNVKVVQGDMTMFSETLMISLDPSGRKLQKAVATGNVRLVNDTITATGEEGTFYNDEQKFELIKQAKVWQENNTIAAHRIIAFLAEEALEGYSDGKPERAVMTIYSTDQFQSPFTKASNLKTTSTDSPDEKPSSTPPSQDESESTEQQAEKTSEKTPIPIVVVSETLRLDNKAKKARFTGDVIATKDVTELQADEMIVYITKTAEGGDDVDKIEVFGHVKITQETTIVTGEEGFFLNQDQYVKVIGNKRKKAHVEDKSQNLVLEAPVIEVYLETNTINATGGVGETSAGEEKGEGSGSQRIRTEFGTDEGASLFEEAPAENEETFTISAKTLELLKSEGVPKSVLDELELLKNQEFSSEKEFVRAIEKQIGIDNASKYQKLILKHSSSKAKEDAAKRAAFPSVTVYPQKGSEKSEKITEKSEEQSADEAKE